MSESFEQSLRAYVACSWIREGWTPPSLSSSVLWMSGSRQWTGFLPPEDFLAELSLSLALNELRNARPAEAAARLDALLDQRPEPAIAPEVLFWKGVAAFRLTGNKGPLWEVWHEIAGRYPDSRWARHTTLLQPGWVEHLEPG